MCWYIKTEATKDTLGIKDMKLKVLPYFRNDITSKGNRVLYMYILYLDLKNGERKYNIAPSVFRIIS